MSLGFKESGKSKSNSVKFTIAYEMLPQEVDLYTKSVYCSENNALGETILNTDIDSQTIILFDRGLNKREIFDQISDRGNLFITRLKQNYKIHITEEKNHEIISGKDSFKEKESNQGHLIITKEQQGYLYKKGGKKKTKHLYRVILCKRKKSNQKSEKLLKKVNQKLYGTKKHADKTKEELVEEMKAEDLVFVTNIPLEQMDAQEIAACYKNRWEIEKFFRFIKQELNFKHFLNRSKNGILSLVYIRMILAILILFYRQKNNLKGYKSVKNAIRLEIIHEQSMIFEKKEFKKIRAGPISDIRKRRI